MSATDGSAALQPRKFRFAAGGEGNAEEGGARRFVKLAQRAEELGYDSFMIPDHLGNQVGPIAALGALAVATDRIRIGTAMLANGSGIPRSSRRTPRPSTCSPVADSNSVSGGPGG